MHTVEAIIKGYLDAILFTETGDGNQPDPDAQLTDATKLQAFKDCRNFWRAADSIEGITHIDPEQIGHDIWLTRNGHGAGFWSRPGVYGIDASKTLTRMARAIGSHDAEFQEEACTD
jgi:hypothetical protein